MKPRPNRFDELLAQGRAMSAEERFDNIRSLSLDPRFAALVAEIRNDWEEFARASGSQKLAPHHGCLEHCSGSLHAIECLETKLRGLAEQAVTPAKGSSAKARRTRASARSRS